MGLTRPTGRWPKGEEATDTLAWPERFGRDALRHADLPETRIEREGLRDLLKKVVLPHVKFGPIGARPPSD
ncbi:MAG: hypothetical protein HRT64_05390 [Erythrobacter sp.]|nr:hypothetical protein [Erythrobacter sp.]